MYTPQRCLVVVFIQTRRNSFPNPCLGCTDIYHWFVLISTGSQSSLRPGSSSTWYKWKLRRHYWLSFTRSICVGIKDIVFIRYCARTENLVRTWGGGGGGWGWRVQKKRNASFCGRHINLQITSPPPAAKGPGSSNHLQFNLSAGSDGPRRKIFKSTESQFGSLDHGRCHIIRFKLR